MDVNSKKCMQSYPRHPPENQPVKIRHPFGVGGVSTSSFACSSVVHTCVHAFVRRYVRIRQSVLSWELALSFLKEIEAVRLLQKGIEKSNQNIQKKNSPPNACQKVQKRKRNTKQKKKSKSTQNPRRRLSGITTTKMSNFERPFTQT